MRMRRAKATLWWLSIVTACGQSVGTDSQSSMQRVEARNNELPASAAGTSSASGPGVPADFSGTITSTMSASQEELDAISAAAALHAARKPATKNATDLGFGRRAGL